ncbi:MAG TPA: hypothetical protein V6C90_13465 [Coleofasciculaceae cyanobacterium]
MAYPIEKCCHNFCRDGTFLSIIDVLHYTLLCDLSLMLVDFKVVGEAIAYNRVRTPLCQRHANRLTT